MFKWNVALAELFNYLLQPFLDSRELALNKVREAKAGRDKSEAGSRSRGEYDLMFQEWRETFVHTLDSIQELYIDYYTQTSELLAGMLTDSIFF